MIAEIRKKAKEEDELTGNFFGNMRYIPFNKGMKKILKKTVRAVCGRTKIQSQLKLNYIFDEIDEDYWDEHMFLWERADEKGKSTELDVRLDFSSVVIGIEVKYRSGLSSEDEEDGGDISAEESVNQLSREARALRLVAPEKKKVLLLLADDLACAETVRDVKIVKGVQLGYFSWQEVLIALKELTDLNRFEQLAVSDLIDLLERKGFSRFSSFEIDAGDISTANISAMDYWQFEPLFSFDIYDKVDLDTMSLGENIFRAFEVVNKTHENVRKLIDFCKVKAEETGEFELRSPKFLRYKSDTDYWGWNTTRMFLVFQDTQDKKLKSGWRNGPLYVLEICLYAPDVYETDEPRIEIAKFEYDNMKSFSGAISPSDYWRFTDPLYNVDYEEPETGIYAAEMPEEMSRKCWGVKRVVCKVEMLADVTYDNAYDMIFGTFKRLKTLNGAP